MEAQRDSGELHDGATRSASGAAASGADSVAETWRIEAGQSRTIDAAGVAALKVGVIGGHVDILGHDEPHARVEVHAVEGRPLEVTLEDGRLTVAHPKLRWDSLLHSLKSLVGDRAKAEVSILVPRAIALSYGQVSAEALISGLRSSGTISTVSGDVQLDDVIGDLTCNTVSGDVQGTGLDGRFAANSVSGDVTAEGRVRDVAIDTVSGTVLLDVVGDPGRLRVNGVSSDVTVRLDAELGVRLTSNSVSGAASITAHGQRASKRQSSIEVPGATIVRIDVNTVSGDVDIVPRSS